MSIDRLWLICPSPGKLNIWVH